MCRPIQQHLSQKCVKGMYNITLLYHTDQEQLSVSGVVLFVLCTVASKMLARLADMVMWACVIFSPTV